MQNPGAKNLRPEHRFNLFIGNPGKFYVAQSCGRVNDAAKRRQFSVEAAEKNLHVLFRGNVSFDNGDVRSQLPDLLNCLQTFIGKCAGIRSRSSPAQQNQMTGALLSGPSGQPQPDTAKTSRNQISTIFAQATGVRRICIRGLQAGFL